MTPWLSLEHGDALFVIVEALLVCPDNRNSYATLRVQRPQQDGVKPPKTVQELDTVVNRTFLRFLHLAACKASQDLQNYRPATAI